MVSYLTKEQQEVVRLWASKRIYLNSITHADQLQELDDMFAVLKNEWAVDFVKNRFDTENDMSDDLIWELQDKMEIAIEGVLQFTIASALSLRHKTERDANATDEPKTR